MTNMDPLDVIPKTHFEWVIVLLTRLSDEELDYVKQLCLTIRRVRAREGQ